MDILHEDTGSKGRYHAIVEGHDAEMTYSRASPHLIIVDHTEVPDALRGKGVDVKFGDWHGRSFRQCGRRGAVFADVLHYQGQLKPEPRVTGPRPRSQ